MKKLAKQETFGIEKYIKSPRIGEIPDAHKNISQELILMSGYYGIKEPSIEVLKLMSLDIVNEYPHLRQGDITRAFKAAAKGDINVSLELYGKPMNAWLIHQIIGAYIQMLNKRKKKYLQERKRKELMEQKRFVAQCPEEISKKFDELIKKYDSKKRI